MSIPFFLTILLASACFLSADISYSVTFTGIDTETEILLSSVSQLVILQDSPPATKAALERRTESDLPNLVRGLQSLGFYNPQIEPAIAYQDNTATITLHIHTGPIYLLKSFTMTPPQDICLSHLGIDLDTPAFPRAIHNGQRHLMDILAMQGYPLAKVTKKEVIADQQTKEIHVNLYVDLGPLAHFGDTTITGQDCVDEAFIIRKIAWCKGELFNPEKMEQTVKDIESAAIFASVSISYAEELDDEGLLPINIQVVEGKHRSLGAGITYSTQIGPGIIGEWEHRNMRGLGEKLSFKADIALRKQTGTLLYLQPDFLIRSQDLYWIAEYESEQTEGFYDTAYSLGSMVERSITDHLKLLYGGKLMQLHTEKSDNNRQFVLVKSPLQLKWNTANSLLDPDKGHCLHLKITPTVQIIEPSVAYTTSQVIASIYQSIRADHKLVISGKVNLASIVGAKDIDIPPPERLYAGSENTLRGYNYLTVSPLDRHHKPIGGRSMMIYTLELRARFTEKWGSALFYEVGNVYEKTFPTFNAQQLQSLGAGLRYHTPVGPLRLDVAFPLNRRSYVDSPFQFYISVGQAF